MLTKNGFKTKFVAVATAAIAAVGTFSFIVSSPSVGVMDSGYSISVSADAAQAYNILKGDIASGGAPNKKGERPISVSKTYLTEGGGTVSYKALTGKKSDDYVVDEGLFQTLTSDAKKEYLTDLNTAADSCVASTDKTSHRNAVTEQTKQNWLQKLQATPGIGSKLMNSILQNTSPDFVTANRIYEPFSGVLGTVLALLAILIMAFLGITMALDLAYLAIPAFRLVLEGDGDGKGGTGNKPKIISSEAFFAMQQAENQGGQGGQDGGGKKVAVGIYFKKRVVMLIALGICLLYLVSGQIYTLVSWVLDLVSGFLGF